MRILLVLIFLVTSAIYSLFVPGAFRISSNPTLPPDSGFIQTPDTGSSTNTAVQMTAVPTVLPEEVIVKTASPAPDSSPETLFGPAKSIDNFERGSSGFGLNAGLNDDSGIRIISLDNKLSLEPKKNNGWLSWRLRPPVLKDGAAEMEFAISTCARGDRTGIMMHSPDYNSGKAYYISLACEGTLSIIQDSTILSSVSVQDIFKNNSGDVNTLSAVISGDTITAFLNGEKALTVHDDTYPEGFSGFFTAAQGQDTLRLDILSFSQYYPGE